MQNPTFRGVVVLVLLVSGLLIIYGRQWSGMTRLHGRSGETGLVYVADLDYWQRTGRERIVEATIPFDLAHDLGQTPLQLGEWQGQDVPETNIEVFILLEPEQFVRRLYRDGAGHYLWLTLIGGRQSRSFHPPDLCYDADGWQTSLSSQAIPLEGGGDIYGLWLAAQKQTNEGAPPTEHLVFYFYLFPDEERDQADGIVLFRLTSPRYGTVEETVALQSSFLRQLFSRAAPVKGSL